MNRRGPARDNREKPKNKKYVIKRLWDYLYKFKWMILTALLLTIASNLFSLVGPLLSGYAIDAIELGVGNVDFEKIYISANLMLIFYILSSILSFVLSRLMTKIGKTIVYQMRKDAFEKMSAMPISYFDNNQIGDIISKFNYDIDTVNTSLSSDLIQICTSAVTIVVSFTMMCIISPIIVVVFLLTIPISILFTRFMIRKTTPLFRNRSRKLGELNGYIEEMISGNKTIKAYGKEQNIIDKFDEYNNISVNATYNAEYYGAITGPGVNFVNNLSLSLICVLGTILCIKGNISLGNIQSFVQYSKKFSGPINEIANLFTDLQSALAAGERVFSLIDGEAEVSDSVEAVELLEVDGNVRFENVKFGYNKDKTIIHNLSFEATKGKVIAIVGPTGAGKTTIVNLLMRFYDIDDGNIYVDDKGILDVTRKSLRKSYAMVLQDTWLFQGSIYENVKYGKDDATMDDVINACKAAKIHSYITHLKDGYDTILTDGGVNISKGQKQLLTIARAYLLDSNMLILDEATSNVDTRTELKIQEAMTNLMKDKTCFIIAHRLSTIQHADLILVVKDGDIIEKGKHNELLANKGFYHKLYYSQFN